jgi:tetratricopeptide (TPR) repeat protein
LAKRGERAIASAQASLAWIAGELERYADGVHRLGEPAYMLDTALPVALAETYRNWDGFELFHESIVVKESRTLRESDDGWLVGEVDGDDLLVSRDGRVWCRDRDYEVLICHGMSFDRWLAGAVAAQAVIYELDGEFRDDVAGEDGELLPEAAVRQQREALKRNKGAPGPSWVLAGLLSAAGEHQEARDLLETAVETVPEFSLAWYDLARISETLGDLEAAADELEAAATANPQTFVLSGYLWAQLARVAKALGDEDRRADAAAKAVEASPYLVRDQLEGARALLAEGNRDGAREAAEIAAAVAPRDLSVLALLRDLR